MDDSSLGDAAHVSEPSQTGSLLLQHRSSWSTPHLQKLAAPTYAPAMTAFGIVFVALGAVTMWIISVVGVVLFVCAIGMWIGDLLHD